MSLNIQAALIIDGKDYALDDSFAEFNQKENIDLSILQRGQGRKNFLNKVKDLLINNKDQKDFTEEDIKGLEQELDLVISISQSKSLEDSLVTGLNYAEIVFIKKELESFSINDYRKAVEEFKNRKRNFGT